MQLRDITVEVRNKALDRLGLIRPEDLDLELSDLHNNVGTWKLAMAVEHPLAGALRQPGSGIVVTGPDGTEVFSGPTTKRESAATADDPAGTITFDGCSDNVLLADFVSLPDPTNPVLDAQTESHDVRTGPAETLMHAYVNANIGPAAPTARRPAGLLVSHLVMGSNLGRGTVITKSARFPVLGNLLSELAGPDNLGFRIIQRGKTLRFETYRIVDRSTEVRLDVYNSTLAGHRVAISPPGATRVLVAGQGDLTERQFFEMETAESVAAEAEWGRRIERFVDQRNTDVEAELQRAGQEVLDEQGFATIAVQAVPMEDTSMVFGRDWYMGDRVGVVVEQQEVASTVTGYVLKVSKDGFRLGALIGDPVGFDPSSALSKRVGNAENRISQLERNAEGGGGAQIQDLDGRLTVIENARSLGANTLSESDPSSNYPLGTSLLSLTASSGWSLNGGVGLVVTDNAGPFRCTQTFHASDDAGTWQRRFHDAAWTGWSKLVADDDPRVVDPSSEWTSYPIAWSADTTQPSIGNGSLQGTYKRIGKTGHVQISLTWGSTTNGGSGFWRFGLPTGWTVPLWLGGSALLRDNSAASHTMGAPSIESGNRMYVRYHGGNPAHGAAPYVWAVNDYVKITAIMEID